MNKRNITLGIAVSLSLLMTGCATTPPDNTMLNEAKASYAKIKDNPDVARSGDSHLRSAKKQLERAESLQESGEDRARIENAAYLANRHAQIAMEQGVRAKLEKQVESAEEQRRKLKLDKSSAEADRLRKEMEELKAERTDRGMVLTLGDVLFDLNKADLKSSGEQTVGRLAQFMQEYEDRRVRVEGYTDSTGADAYNQKLSERRAGAVKDALLSQGIEGERVETRGYGKQYPVSSNDTSAGRQQNRRVEIVISDEDGNIETR